MSKSAKVLWAAALLRLVGASGVEAENYTTNIYNGVTNTFSGAATVGDNGSYNHLAISGAARITGDGWIFVGSGQNSGVAHDNSALVSGAGSLWLVTHDLYIGLDASTNSLSILNGGQVSNAANSMIGYHGGIALPNDNSALVSGPGSAWRCSTLSLGYYGGSGNSLTISNGGQVINSGSAGDYIGFWDYSGTSANNNSVLVTGSNSVWSAAGNIRVGYAGSSNLLSIADGGLVTDGYGNIGIYGPHNEVRVADPGSLWSNRYDVRVGFQGDSNSLVVVGGGRVADLSGVVGYYGSNNTALIAGPGSLWTNAADLFVGYSSPGNRLIVSNGAAVVNNNGYIGFWAACASNSVLVSGAGSIWSNRADLFVGYNGGSNNSLAIADGAALYSRNAFIGGTNGANNTVLVTGTNSVWHNAGSIVVGPFESGNRLVFTNGGAMSGGNVDVQRGSLTLQDGTMGVESLSATGATSTVIFNGGTLNVSNVTVANGSLFGVGNGTNTATLDLRGGVGAFLDSLVVSSNATLAGTGTIAAPHVKVDAGGSISPGHSIGVLDFTNDVALGGTLVIDLDAVSGVADLINVAGTLDIGTGTVSFTTIGIPASNAYVFATYGVLVGEEFYGINNLPAGYSIDYHYGALGNEIALVIPEPPAFAAFLLLIPSFAGLIALRRRGG